MSTYTPTADDCRVPKNLNTPTEPLKVCQVEGCQNTNNDCGGYFSIKNGVIDFNTWTCAPHVCKNRRDKNR